MSPRSSTRRWIGSEKNTGSYKAKLSKAEQKAFRSLMWEFRRNPQDLSEEKRAKLQGLFAKLPRLRSLYEIRVCFQQIFDTGADRRSALRSLTGLWLDILEHFPTMGSFIRMFEAWQEEILNYFEARQSSGPVEGIKNKARVIVKRANGLKSAGSLWSRLILDLNRGKDIVLHMIGQIRELVVSFRTIFAQACT